MKPNIKIAGVVVVAAAFAAGGFAVGQGTDPLAKSADQQAMELALQYDALRSTARAEATKIRIAELLEKPQDKSAATEAMLEAEEASAIALRKGIRDAKFTERVLLTTVTNYHGSIGRAGSAPQATQVASETMVETNFLIVAQNARIIELLEQIAAKK